MQSFLVGDVLKKEVFEGAGGERFITMAPTADGSPVLHSLDFLMASYGEADVQLKLGETAASASTSCFIMKLPRACSQRVFFGLFGVYRLLDLESFAGQPCKWSYAGVPRWRRKLEDHLVGEHFIASKHRNNSAEKVSKTRWPDRCLPEPSFSTVACLVLLAHWAFSPAQSGGFHAGKSKGAARCLLAAMIAQACPHRVERPVRLIIDDKWQCLLPGPAVIFTESPPIEVELSLSSTGVVDLGPLFSAPEGGERIPTAQSRWLVQLQRCGFGIGRTQVPLIQLLEHIAPCRKLSSFVQQLMLHVSFRFEVALAGALGESDTTFNMNYPSQMPAPDDPTMEEKLYKYVVAGAGESMKHLTLTIATDKASPAFQSLTNAVMVFPNGVAVLCCPQAGLCVHRVLMLGQADCPAPQMRCPTLVRTIGGGGDLPHGGYGYARSRFPSVSYTYPPPGP